MGDEIISHYSKDIYSDLNDPTCNHHDPRLCVNSSGTLKNERMPDVFCINDQDGLAAFPRTSSQIAVNGRKNTGNDIFNVVASRTMLETEGWKSEMALYDELVAAEVKEREEKLKNAIRYEDLFEEVKQLRIANLEKDTKISELKLENVNLKKNLCSLCKTIKSEIERKDCLLLEANSKLDQIRIRKNICLLPNADFQTKNIEETPKETNVHHSGSKDKSRKDPENNDRDRLLYYHRQGSDRKGKYYDRKESSYKSWKNNTRENYKEENSSTKVDSGSRRKQYSAEKALPKQNQQRNHNFEENKPHDERESHSEQSRPNSKDKFHHKSYNINKTDKINKSSLKNSESELKDVIHSSCCEASHGAHDKEECVKNKINCQNEKSDKSNQDVISVNILSSGDAQSLSILNRASEVDQYMDLEILHDPSSVNHVNKGIENHSQNENKLMFKQNNPDLKWANKQTTETIMSTDEVQTICDKGKCNTNQINSQNENELKSLQVNPDLNSATKQSLDCDQTSTSVIKAAEAHQDDMEVDSHCPLSVSDENKDEPKHSDSEQGPLEMFKDSTVTNALFFGLLPKELRKPFMQYEQRQITATNMLKQSFVNYYFMHYDGVREDVDVSPPDEPQEGSSECATQLQNLVKQKDVDSPLFFFERDCDNRTSSHNLNSSQAPQTRASAENATNALPSGSDGMNTHCQLAVSLPNVNSKSVCSQDNDRNTDSTKEIPPIFREMFQKQEQPLSNLVEDMPHSGNLSAVRNCNSQTEDPISSLNINSKRTSLLDEQSVVSKEKPNFQYCKVFDNNESHQPSFSSVYYRRQLLKSAIEETRQNGLTKATKELIAKLYKYKNAKTTFLVKSKTKKI